MGIEKVVGSEYAVEVIKQNTGKHKPKTIQDVPNPLENTYQDKYNDAAVAEIKNPERSNLNEIQEKMQVAGTTGVRIQKVRETIEAIDNYDGFLLGAYEQIDQISSPMQFKLKDILKVEERIDQLDDTLELGIFTIHRIQQEAAKALRGQANIEPENALALIQ